MIAAGSSVNGARTALEAAKVSPPRGVHWQRTFIRECIFDDVCKPHSFEEVAALASPQVASRLDPERSYGIWWYNRRDAQRTRVFDDTLVASDATLPARAPPRSHARSGSPYPFPTPAFPGMTWSVHAKPSGTTSSSSAGRRFWELSGGIFRCAECGRALVAVTTLKGPKGRRRRMFYYMCATRRQRGKHACSFSKSMNAHRTESAVWDAVSTLLTDPKSLRSDLEAMIEREKETRGDPEREASAWAASLAEAERKREKYQQMYAADAMTLEELRSRLKALEETYESARREFAELESWHERLQVLERDKELLLESYTTRAPEALDSLGAEERRTVYSMLGLRVEALPDKSLRVHGAFGEENLVCHHDRTSTR
jgi:hypothetical protein